ncbi:Hypothetical protein A7982_04533 [Minicystis rosea]|nr:Hypothetical protein A7982_04533 [Minicystis rosea]
MKRSLSLLFLLAISACTHFTAVGSPGDGGAGGAGGQHTGDGGQHTGGAAPENPACGAGIFGEALLACGLNDEVAVTGADADNVYFLDLSAPGLDIYRMGRADFAVTRIHQGDNPWPSASIWAERVGDWYPLHAGKIYVDVRLNEGNEAFIGKKLVELDAASGDTRDVVDGPADNAWAVDGGFIYWQKFDAGAPTGAVARTDLATKETVVLDPEGGFVWGTAQGFLYYARYTPPQAGQPETYMLTRISTNGGSPEPLVNIGPLTRYHDSGPRLAVDADGSVYLPGFTPTGGTLDHFVPGVGRETLGPWPAGGDNLRIIGDELYFWGDRVIQRMSKKAGAAPERVFGPAGDGTEHYAPGAPVVLGSTLFTAYRFSEAGAPTTGRVASMTLP